MDWAQIRLIKESYLAKYLSNFLPFFHNISNSINYKKKIKFIRIPQSEKRWQRFDVPDA